MNEGETVRYEVNDGIALLTLNRPHALNAVTMAMAALLEERLREADEDPAVQGHDRAAKHPAAPGSDDGVMAAGSH